jgi:hypothetical protein
MEDFISIRQEICKACPLNKNDICNSSLYLNKETNQISLVPKEGFKNGCGCYLPAKIKNEYSHCPLVKW